MKSSHTMSAKSELALELRGVSKRYGAKRALDAISLSLERGKVLGLVGPNGAGKTTALSLLAGFTRPSSGTVRVLGKRGGPHERVGVLAQRAALPKNETVGHFLLHLARLQRLERADAALRRVLQRVGAEHTLAMRCGDLSFGMEKRIFLAQALLGEPWLLLLDEPTAGVDALGVSEITKVLRAFEGTIVLASHSLPQIEGLCDEVATLDEGRLVEQISMEQIRALRHVHVRLTHWQLPPPALAELQASFDVQLLEASCALRLRPKAPAQQQVSDVLRVLLRHDVPITSVNEVGPLQQHLDALASGDRSSEVASVWSSDSTTSHPKVL